ncbi:hypothetical protein BJY52DRAFT_1413526 [Lactarius psammicola]|nr:hypothetical protein BJY52DRAFT_1413526 [Lactarius psammicola]
MTATADMIRVMVHRADVPGAVGEVNDHGHPGVVHLPEIVALAPLLHHRVVAHHTGVPQSPFDPDNAVDVRHAQRDLSPPPTSPRPPPPIEARTSTPRASSIPLPLDKGKARATAQPGSDANEDVKMDDVAPPQQNLQPTDQSRKLSPQPPTGAPTTAYALPPHPGLPANPKRSRTAQSGLPNSNAGRSSNVRMPPIPPYEIKEIVKESLNKEISRLASLNASQKAATEPLIRAAERSRHELEMSLLELYAAAERRKAAAAQVEEARAGTLGIGGRHEYSTGVSDS